jgi:hypothetical protein
MCVLFDDVKLALHIFPFLSYTRERGTMVMVELLLRGCRRLLKTLLKYSSRKSNLLCYFCALIAK